MIDYYKMTGIDIPMSGLITDVLDNSIIIALMSVPMFTRSKTSLWITMATIPFVMGVKYYLYKKGNIKVYPRIMDIGAMLITVVLLIFEYTVPEKDKDSYRGYQDLVRYIGLLIIVVVSLLLGHPITSQYRKELVPESVWDTQKFKDDNIRSTKVWAFAIFVMGLLSTMPKMVGKSDSKLYRIIFTILIPMVIFLGMREYGRKTIPKSYGEALTLSAHGIAKNVTKIGTKVKAKL